MVAMADGWLPPRAPGANPPPRFDAPPDPATRPQAPPEPARPAFAHAAAAGPGEGNGAAVWAIALGITGLALLVFSLGTLFALTLPCSAASWALAGRARRRIESGATTRGEGQAAAALWLGRIGVIAGVAAMVVFIALLASGFDFEQLRDDLQRELDRRRERQDGSEGADGVRTALEHMRAAVGAWPAR
jgi:hypothetical protein